MSIKLMSQVWEKDLPHNQKLVLLALADHANDEGSCFPSIRRIAWKTNYSPRAVQRIIRQLEERQIVNIDEEAPGRPGIARTYAIRLVNAKQSAPFETGANMSPLAGRRVSSATETGDISDQTGDIPGATGDIAVSPESSLEPSFESSSNRGEKSRKPYKPTNPHFKTFVDEEGLTHVYDERGGRWEIQDECENAS